jgi:hypothetical protein
VRRLVLAVAVFLSAVGSASAATTPTEPVFNARGRIIKTPLAPPNQPAVLTADRAIAIFRADPKVKDWLARYPKSGRTADAQFHEDFRYWQVNLWWGKAARSRRVE